jgi:hypothetical protein
VLLLIVAGLFTGYQLVYAAVAHGGKYATRPWDALLETPAAAGQTQRVQEARSSSGGVLGAVVGGVRRWLDLINGGSPRPGPL